MSDFYKTLPGALYGYVSCIIQLDMVTIANQVLSTQLQAYVGYCKICHISVNHLRNYDHLGLLCHTKFQWVTKR